MSFNIVLYNIYEIFIQIKPLLLYITFSILAINYDIKI